MRRRALPDRPSSTNLPKPVPARGPEGAASPFYIESGRSRRRWRQWKPWPRSGHGEQRRGDRTVHGGLAHRCDGAGGRRTERHCDVVARHSLVRDSPPRARGQGRRGDRRRPISLLRLLSIAEVRSKIPPLVVVSRSEWILGDVGLASGQLPGQVCKLAADEAADADDHQEGEHVRPQFPKARGRSANGVAAARVARAQNPGGSRAPSEQTVPARNRTRQRQLHRPPEFRDS
jgi:hypothetical protein